jgi:hypothetical protein
MGPTDMSSKQQMNMMETLDNDSSNWPFWRSRMKFLFESKGLLAHIKGTAVKEGKSSDNEDNDIAFTNTEAVFISKTSSGVTHILNTGASSHMMSHKNLLRDYKAFETPKHISATNKEGDL